MPHAVLLDGCSLGARVRLQPGAVVGGDGFGYAASAEGLLPVPQLGVAVIEDDVEIGVNSCVDRAALDETRVGAGTRIDNLVQIAHGVRIGRDCLLAAFAAVSGGATLGRRVIMAGRTAVTEHVKIGDGAILYGMSATSRDLEPGARVGGAPARPYGEWAREQVALHHLPGLVRSVDRLKKRLEALERSIVPPAPSGGT
jgi:UDP-3-O-[3-hydroxymyristoyl] glucosamine N-acyltransferase